MSPDSAPEEDDLGSAFDEPRRVGAYRSKTAAEKADADAYWELFDKVQAGEHIADEYEVPSLPDPIPTYGEYRRSRGEDPLEKMYGDNTDIFGDDYDPSEDLIDVGGDIDDPLS